MKRYSPQETRIYDSLGVLGTTYEIGFSAVQHLLGDVTGKTILDFGSGTGRSAEYLVALGVGAVVGVDHDQAMIDTATAKGIRGAEFWKIGNCSIPAPDMSFDAAICLSVLIEVRTQRELEAICREVARLLRPGGVLVIQSTNPEAFGHTFRSFSYSAPASYVSGSTAICTIKTTMGTFDIEDTYWTEGDYVSAVEQARLSIEDILYPRPPDPETWLTAEARVAPFILLKAGKPAHPRPL